MSESNCRSCWLSTLPPSERERIAAEPVTMPVHLCAEHQAAWDRVQAKFPAIATIQERVERSSLGTPAARAARASVSDERARRIVARAEEIRQEKGGPTQHRPTCTICRESLDVSSRVTELAAQWEADDADHLDRYGQHLPASVARMAELLREAINPGSTLQPIPEPTDPRIR